MHHYRCDALVKRDAPVAEYLHPQISEVAERVARYIASIIDDGSTLQIGLGRVPNEALRYLRDRRDLGIHSDVITDGVGPGRGGRSDRSPQNPPSRSYRRQLLPGDATTPRRHRQVPAL